MIEAAGKVINQMEKNDLYKAPTLSVFSLNRVKAHCHYPPVTVDFTNPIPKLQLNSVFPVYNNDLCHFTPAFLLPADKTYTGSYLTSEHQKFADRMRTEQEQLECSTLPQSEIRLRASEIRFCLVCKQRYEDYWTHTDCHLHKRKIAKNQYNNDIAQLCQRFNPHQSQPPTAKKATSKKNRNNRNNKPDHIDSCHSDPLLKIDIDSGPKEKSVQGC